MNGWSQYHKLVQDMPYPRITDEALASLIAKSEANPPPVPTNLGRLEYALMLDLRDCRERKA